MSLVNKLARSFLTIAIVCVTVWIAGCAGNDEDEDNGGGENGNGAATQETDNGGTASETP